MTSAHPADRELHDAYAARFRAEYPLLCVEIHPDDEMYAFAETHLGLKGPTAFREYLQTGRLNFTMLEQVLAWAGKRWTDIGAALDFGSGYGRTTRFLSTSLPGEKLWVSDILAPAVAFQVSTFKVHGFPSHRDPAKLVLPRSYDFISVISLFSHLPHETFGAWLNKLATALQPGGILVFTAHGPSEYQLSFKKEMEGPFAFHETSEIPSLETKSYGQTFCDLSYVQGLLDSMPGVDLLAHVDQGLNNHQDVYVIGRECDPPRHSCRLRNPPRGIIEYIGYENEALHVRGWALDRNDLGPVSRVSLSLDDHPLGEACLNETRPDLVEAFGSDASAQGGWSFTGSTPDTHQGAKWLTAWIEDREGSREFLLARNAPTSSPCY